MPEVNLLKDTENSRLVPKKPLVPGAPELTDPNPDSGPGMLGMIKSLFHRGPRALPVAPVPPPARAVGLTTPAKGTSGERILSETKHAPATMIPLPEDEGSYNVNLLSDDLVSTVSPRQRAILLGVIALAAAMVVGLAYGGLLLYQNKVKSDIAETNSQLKVVDQEINTQNIDQATASTTAQKLNAIRTLVDRHTRWTKFFAQLEKYTLPEVTYGPSFTGDLNGSVTFLATTTSYEKVAQQYLIFQQLARDKKFISAFTITGATSATDKDGLTKATFTIGLTLLPDNFTMTSDEAKQAADRLIGVSAQSTAVPTAADIVAVLTDGPPGAGFTTIDGVRTMTKAYADLENVYCYLYDHPANVQSLPTFAQAGIQAALTRTLNSRPLYCAAATSDRLAAGALALTTDADQDGVDLLFEQLYGTSDATAATAAGQNDFDAIQKNI